MSFLKEIGKRKPTFEGRGIKVFRLIEEVKPGTVVKVDGKVCKVEKKLRHYSHEEPFYICKTRNGDVVPARESEMVFEGWGWEDVWQDMMTDKSIRRLKRDVVRLLRDGTPIGLIEDNLDHLIDKASTRLTTEEKVVFLKWLEKNKKRLTPELGLRAYNRNRRPVAEAKYYGHEDIPDHLPEWENRKDLENRYNRDYIIFLKNFEDELWNTYNDLEDSMSAFMPEDEDQFGMGLEGFDYRKYFDDEVVDEFDWEIGEAFEKMVRYLASRYEEQWKDEDEW